MLKSIAFQTEGDVTQYSSNRFSEYESEACFFLNILGDSVLSER